MNRHPTLRTARLTLRPLRDDDAVALHEFYTDEVAMQWWSHGPFEHVDQTRQRLASAIDNDEWRGWAITLTGNDTAIGTLAAGQKRQGRVVEIGYSLLRRYWRGGIVREAVTALIDMLFADGIRRVFADTDPDNIASRRLLESLGFQLEGVLRGEWETHIGIRDTTLYGLLKDEWPARPVIRAESASALASSAR